MCRLTYDVLLTGRKPVEISVEQGAELKPMLQQNTPRAYWEGAVRLLLQNEPEVLE